MAYERIKTDVPGFDELLGKGIPSGSSIVVKGGPGSGKTIFCLQNCINFAKKGKKCLYLSFEETRADLEEHINALGGELNDNIRIKKMDITDVWVSLKHARGKRQGIELVSNPDGKIEDINLIPKDFTPDLIILDSLTAISSFFSDSTSEYRAYLEEVFKILSRSNTMSYLIVERDPLLEGPATFEEFMSDGVFMLYNVRKGDIRENAIEVLKLRATDHQKKIAAMQITDKGIRVYPDQQVFGLEK